MDRPERMIPGATYRLQINRLFPFDHAAGLVPYLKKLGITHIYASPIFQAHSGSLHGYDVTDYTVFHKESGGEASFIRLSDELRSQSMGMILDFVPNHMGIHSPENRWWYEVLENGRASWYAETFDIDWEPVKQELKDKVLLPILGDQYGKILEKGDLKLMYHDGSFQLSYYEHVLPISPESFMLILDQVSDDFESGPITEAEDINEFHSICTAIRNLSNLKNDESLNGEEFRATHFREKEAIKRRLRELLHASERFAGAIESRVQSINGKADDPSSFNELDRIHSVQNYRLCFWQVATEEINYRRFFDINHLGAIRMEDPEVFRTSHQLVLRLIKENRIDGIRIDHPDGLYDPEKYFRDLQKYSYAMIQLRGSEEEMDEESLNRQLEQYDQRLQEDPAYMAFYILGEKILEEDESMPDNWLISGTTGYRFLNTVNALFVNSRNEKKMTDLYHEFTGDHSPFPDIVYEKKRLILRSSMAGEINTLGHILDRISENDRHTRDFTLNSIIRSLVDVIACFPVYRTYISSFFVDERDRTYINQAVNLAIKKNQAITASVLEFVRDVLLLNFPERFSEEDKLEWLKFVMRFQQITGPVMAKGLEDTAFYNFNRLTSLNEVGGSPDRFGLPEAVFHERNLERQALFPNAMNTSSTHDTKRSEDVRARLNVLSEFPDEFRQRLYRWSYSARSWKSKSIHGHSIPDRNDEYLLYQTMLGIWPQGGFDAESLENTSERLQDYMIKAVREAKKNSSWLNPNEEYEQSIRVFITRLFSTAKNRKFLNDVQEFSDLIGSYGMLNSLSITTLKLTSPGMPDFYQGTELWDYSLVDPDNRRPVEFELRERILDEIVKKRSAKNWKPYAMDLFRDIKSGRIKMYIIYALLQLRNQSQDLFKYGDYIPLHVHGSKRDHLVAFVRRLGSAEVLVLGPRFFSGFHQGGVKRKSVEQNSGPLEWEDTRIDFHPAGSRYRNVFTGKIIGPEDSAGTSGLSVLDCMDDFPVSVLEKLE